jgi:hypothetical protein
MRVLVLVKANEESEAGQMPSEQLVREMTAFNEELVKAGVMLTAEGLHPSRAGKRVVYSNKQRKVIDGPFAETKELVAGFWIWKVRSMEEAVALAERCPNPHGDDGIIELRPIFDYEDFADAAGLSNETREQQQRIDVALSAQQAKRH